MKLVLNEEMRVGKENCVERQIDNYNDAIIGDPEEGIAEWRALRNTIFLVVDGEVVLISCNSHSQLIVGLILWVLILMIWRGSFKMCSLLCICWLIPFEFLFSSGNRPRLFGFRFNFSTVVVVQWRSTIRSITRHQSQVIWVTNKFRNVVETFKRISSRTSPERESWNSDLPSL